MADSTLANQDTVHRAVRLLRNDFPNCTDPLGIALRLNEHDLLRADPPPCGAVNPESAELGPHAVTCTKPAGHEHSADPDKDLHRAGESWRWPAAPVDAGTRQARDNADRISAYISARAGVPLEYTRRVLRALFTIRHAYLATEDGGTVVRRETEYAVDLMGPPPSELIIIGTDRDAAETLGRSHRRAAVLLRAVTTIIGAWRPRR